VFIKAPLNSPEFSQNNGPRFSLLDLGLSKVVLASSVLRVGLQQARSMSKSAERGAVLHVHVRKDATVKIILAEE